MYLKLFSPNITSELRKYQSTNLRMNLEFRYQKGITAKEHRQSSPDALLQYNDSSYRTAPSLEQPMNARPSADESHSTSISIVFFNCFK